MTVESAAWAVRKAYERRIGRDVTIEEVSKAIGMSRAALSRLEAGKTKGITWDVLDRLCAFYGVEPGDLIKRT